MKSILLKFTDNVLSKNEMKALKGGNMYAGTCNQTVAACYRSGKRNNAKDGPGGWQCC
jgi:natural product precursor